MSLFRRAQSSRTYPAAGIPVVGRADRFRRSKTSGARKAGAAAEKWDAKDRAQERGNRWYRPAR